MKFTTILCFGICVILNSFGQSDVTRPGASRPDSISIAGNISLEGGATPESMSFAFWDHWLGINQNVHVMVDANGDFSTKIFLRGSNAVLCWYNDVAKRRHHSFLLLEPGDSLYITVRNHDYSFVGRNAAATTDLYQMRTQKEWSTYNFALDTGYRLEPEVYLQFRKQHYEDDMKFVENYCATRNCSDLFKRWYIGDAKVRYFRDLMNYSWRSRKYGLGSEVRLTGERSEKYKQAFIGEIDLDDPAYEMSYTYSPFVNAYFMKVEKKTPFDLVPKEIQVTKLQILLDLVAKEVALEVDATSAKKRALENLLRNAHANTRPDSADIKLMWRISEQYDKPLREAMSVWYTNQMINRISSVNHDRIRDLTFLHTFMREMDTAPDLDYFYKSMHAHMTDGVLRDELTRQYEKRKKEDAIIKNPTGGIHV